MSAVIPARVLLADPPWKFGDKLPGKRGAAYKYLCMEWNEIGAYPLPRLADDSLLLLWRCASMQYEALWVMRAWGFELKGEIVWNKLTLHGKPWFGMGRYVRNCHETCLIGVRGRVKIKSHSIRSTFSAYAGGPEHSRKPDRIYEIAETLSIGPYQEIFATRRHTGWRQSGLLLP